MELNDIITFIFMLIFLFFSLLGNLKKKKDGKNKKAGLFARLRSQFQELKRQLEEEARQQQGRKAQPPPGEHREAEDDFWAGMAESESVALSTDKVLEEEEWADQDEDDWIWEDEMEEPVPAATPDMPEDEKMVDAPVPVQAPAAPPLTSPSYPSRAHLRQAVIWSEILGKPLALRQDLSGGKPR